MITKGLCGKISIYENKCETTIKIIKDSTMYILLRTKFSYILSEIPIHRNERQNVYTFGLCK